MSVEQIIFFGRTSLKNSEKRLKDKLLPWMVKWFGQDQYWEVNLNQVDDDLNDESIELEELINNESTTNEIACTALKISTDDGNLPKSSLLNELGRKIVSELVDLLNDIKNETPHGIRANPHDSLKNFVLSFRIANTCMQTTLPIAVVLYISRNIEIKEGYTLESISLGDINGNIKLNISLQGAELTVEELLALEKGDVLTLEHSLSTPAMIKKHGGEILLEGQLGKTGINKSILITRAGRQ